MVVAIFTLRNKSAGQEMVKLGWIRLGSIWTTTIVADHSLFCKLYSTVQTPELVLFKYTQTFRYII